MSQYFYRIFGVKFGPVSLELLQHEIASGQLLDRNEVRAENESNWISVADFVARRETDRNPVQHSAPSTLTWDGGHDDIETIDKSDADQSTNVPGLWFCRGSRVGRGPYNFDELRSFARRQELAPDDELSLTDHGPWTPVRSIGPLMAEMPASVITEIISPIMSAETTAETELVTQGKGPVFSGQEPVAANQRPVLTDGESELGNTEDNTLWYVRMGHVEHGPIELQKMINMIEAGRILPTDRVRQRDTSEWKQVHAIPALFPSKSNQSGSTFSLKSVRPTIPVPQNYVKKGGYSAHVVPIPPIMPVPVQYAPPAPWSSTSSLSAHSTVQRSARAAESASSPATELRALISSSGLPTESSRISTMGLPKSRPGETATERNSDAHQSSGQPISDPPLNVAGESKHKLRSGQFKEPQLVDAKNLIMAAGVLLAVLFTWRSFMTASIEEFVVPYSDLAGNYRSLDEKRSENPTMELWAFARKEVVYKIESIKQKIRNLNSTHPIRNMLLSLGDSLVAAAKSETRDDVALHMQDAHKLLVDSSKEFRKWKDEEFQKEIQRKGRVKPNADALQVRE